MSKFTLLIRNLKSQEIKLENVSPSDLVSDVKKRIEEELQQGAISKMIYKGAIMSETKTFEQANYNPKDYIVIMADKKKTPEAKAVAPTPAPAPDATPTPAAPSTTSAPSPAPSLTATTLVLPPATAATAPSEWMCPGCTFLNVATKAYCDMCNTQNPSATPELIAISNSAAAGAAYGGDMDAGDGAGGNWQCGSCTFINPGPTPGCGMCGTPNPAAPAGMGGFPGMGGAGMGGLPQGMAFPMGPDGAPMDPAALEAQFASMLQAMSASGQIPGLPAGMPTDPALQAQILQQLLMQQGMDLGDMEEPDEDGDDGNNFNPDDAD